MESGRVLRSRSSEKPALMNQADSEHICSATPLKSTGLDQCGLRQYLQIPK
jgi:hypothetical protein